MVRRLDLMAKYSGLALCFAELSFYVRGQMHKEDLSASEHTKLNSRLKEGLETLTYHSEKSRGYNEKIEEALQYCKALHERPANMEDLEKYAAFFKDMTLNFLRDFDRVRLER